MRIYIEAPNGDRFEADIPCGTKISNIAADFFESQGWLTNDRRSQRVVVDLVDPENPDNTKHLNGNRDICKSGLRDGDTLRISSEPHVYGSPPVFGDMGIWLHDSVNRHHILRSHKELICQVVWSPNGRVLASASIDRTICFWDTNTGKLLRVLPTGHWGVMTSIAWSPDSRILASASTDEMIYLWNVSTGQCLYSLTGHRSVVTSIAWSPDSKILASACAARTIHLWDIDTRQLLHTFMGHQNAVNSVAWSPDGKILASASTDRTVRLWDVDTKQLLYTFTGHQDAVNSVVWSPDSKILASSAEDTTIRIWDVKHKHPKRILQGIAGFINSISFSFDGRFLASRSSDGTIALWRSDIWEELVIVREESSNGMKGDFGQFSRFTFHPQALVMATSGEGNSAIYILDLNLDTLFASYSTSSVNYANAKVVLLGDSSVGKTGLALVLTARTYECTDSTHGRHVWVFDNTEVALDGVYTETREILLWDLAGQSGYRLIHQLHLNEAIVALIVFDNRSETNPFAGVHYWNRALCQAQQVNDPPLPLRKILVAARVDRAGIAVSHDRVDQLINKLGFDDYFETSAQEGQNIAELRRTISASIDWRVIPKVTSTRFFHDIRCLIIEKKSSKRLTYFVQDLYHDFSGLQGSQNNGLYEQIDNCIRLIESQGLIRRFRLGNCVLLQPELLDAYASALVNAMKDEPDGFGYIDEKQVKKAKFFIPIDIRLEDKGLERLLLVWMVEDLIDQEVVLREQIDNKFYLIFPSQSSRERDTFGDMGRERVAFSFEGPVRNIYATLVVRLSLSKKFKRKDLWRNAVAYEAIDGGGTYEILLKNTDEGEGSLTLFFEETSEEMSLHFEDFVYHHLVRRFQLENVNIKRNFSCKKCNIVFPNDIVHKRLELNFDWLRCPICDNKISLDGGQKKNENVHSSFVSEMNRNADIGCDSSKTAFVFQVRQEIHMSNGDNISISTRDVSNIGGQQILGGNAENVSANIAPRQDQGELIRALQTLKEFVSASTHLPDDEKQEQTAIITRVIEEVAKPEPNKTFLKVVGNGLLATLKVIPDVVKAVTDVIPLLNNLLI